MCSIPESEEFGVLLNSMATEDLCIACAEPLDWTAFGPCGHKDACSRCVSRLRFLLEDKKCMMCKQENLQLYFTRFNGDFTLRLGPDQFAQLKVSMPVSGRDEPPRLVLNHHRSVLLQDRARTGELYELPEVDGYFDDREHYDDIK